MDGSQQLVAVGGLALVAANFWTGSQRSAVSGVLWGAKGADVTAGHQAILGIAGELVLVVVLAMAAGASDSLSYGMLAIVAALWILWGMHYYGAGGAGSKTTASTARTA